MGLRSACWIVAIGTVVSLTHIRTRLIHAEGPVASPASAFDRTAPPSAQDPRPKTQDPKAASAADRTPSPSDSIARLVEQLDAPRFADREAASAKLAALGKTTIPALSKAAASESAEASARAIDLLRKLLDASDPATSDAAKIALEALAKNDRQTLARRAQEVLRTNQEEQRRTTLPQAPNGFFQGGALRIGVPGGARTISMRNVNGVKEINVDETGRKIKIHDDPLKGIRIEVTSKKNGKDVTEKYEAKDAEELKKKHPEGHKIYELYGKNQGGLGVVQFQIQGGAGPLFRMPVLPGNFPMPQVQPFPGNLEEHQVRTATLLLKNAGMQLDRLRQDQWKQVPETAREDLKQQLAALKRQMADLEKRLPVKDAVPAKPPRTPP
jgi:hypothetical protein